MADLKLDLDTGNIIKVNGEVGADHAWSVEGLANNAARVSIQIDLGVAPRAERFYWMCEAIWDATPVQNTTLDLYKAGALDTDNTLVAGGVGVADAALGSVDQLSQLGPPFGFVVVETADSTVMRAEGVFTHVSRYLSLIAHNNGVGATLSAVDSDFKFFLMPYFHDIT